MATFTIERDLLKKALGIVVPTIKGGAGMEILGCVLITVDAAENAISFTTSRIETTTQHILVDGITITQSCTLALPAARLSELVNQMTGDILSFTPAQENDWWDIAYEVPGSKKPGVAQVGGLDPSHFPTQKIAQLRTVVSFGAEQFGSYLKQVFTMLSKSGTYAVLEAMCMDLHEDSDYITLYGADQTHGIARIYMPISERFEGYAAARFLIPQKSVATLMNAKPTTNEITLLVADESSQIGFRFGPTTIVTSTMTDQYPKVETFFRESSTYAVTLETKALQRVVTMAQTLYGNEVKAIILSLESDHLHVKSYKTVGGAIDQEVPVSEITEGGFIQVNPGYLGDSLSALDTHTVTLEIESQAHALFIRSSEKPNCLHQIFPMHGTVPGKGVSK